MSVATHQMNSPSARARAMMNGARTRKAIAAACKGRHGVARPPFERITWLIQQLFHGRKVNQTLISRKFEVSLKTAQHDIDFARDRLSIPFEYDRYTFTYRLTSFDFSCPICGQQP